MGKQTAIEWTDHTWNPWTGCHRVSPGCAKCYMEREQRRWGRDPHRVTRTTRATFRGPFRWKEPGKVFVCSWSDFFHADADQWRDDAWGVIRATPWHIYQIPTKRPERILDTLPPDWEQGWPHVWLGVSVENQEATHRLDTLREIPASLRWVSAEPLLGPLDLGPWLDSLGWIVAGGESDPRDPRSADPEWFRVLREQAHGAGIPFFFKQQGGKRKINGSYGGNVLDGQTWQEFPSLSVD